MMLLHIHHHHQGKFPDLQFRTCVVLGTFECFLEILFSNSDEIMMTSLIGASKPQNVQWIQCRRNVFLVHTSPDVHNHWSHSWTQDPSFRLFHALKQEGCTSPSFPWKEKEHKGFCTKIFHGQGLEVARVTSTHLRLAKT